VAVVRTAAGLRKFRALRPGSRVALVAPSSPFDREAFDAGCRELARLGLQPVFDERVFESGAIVAGTPAVRAASFLDAWRREDVDALMAVRGGYGAVEILPLVTPVRFAERVLPFVGYSDTTALHTWLNGHAGMTSIHGVMIEGRLARGEAFYDADTCLRALGAEPLGELAPDGLDVVRPGEAVGTLVGGTLTQLCASLGTPYDFRPPSGAVIFIEEVSERPYRIRRMLTQLQQSGRLAGASALVFGQLPGCDEPDGRVTARAVVEEFTAAASFPVLWGFPSGHTVTPLVSLPFGVRARVVTDGRPRLILEEAAGE
jgi:muramoyltetrapeptide carboxypeptidase